MQEGELFVKRKTQAEREYLEMRGKAEKIHKKVEQGVFKNPQIDLNELFADTNVGSKVSKIWNRKIKQKPEEQNVWSKK